MFVEPLNQSTLESALILNFLCGKMDVLIISTALVWFSVTYRQSIPTDSLRYSPFLWYLLEIFISFPCLLLVACDRIAFPLLTPQHLTL